jgi:hypothetical protein
MPTLEEILKKRFESNVAGVSQNTRNIVQSDNTAQSNTNPQNRGMNFYSQSQPAQIKEKSMYQGLGAGMWDFTREFGEGLFDTATFGAVSALSDWEPEDDKVSEAAKWGGDIGTAAGFLIPFGAGKAAISKTVQAVSKASGVKIGKNIADDVFKQSDDLGIAFAKKNLDEGASVVADDVTKLGIAGAFKKHVLDEKLIKPLAGFDDALADATKRKAFWEQVDDEGMTILREFAEAKGFTVTEKAANQINSIVVNSIAKGGGRPVSNLAGLVAKKLGDGKKASFYSHMFEEAMVFAAVDNVLHGIDAAAGEHDWDPLSTTTHALALGHALGAVRFIPGGIKGGTMGIFNLKGVDKVRAIMKGTSAKGYNLGTDAGQQAVGRQFSVLGGINSTELGGVELSRIVSSYLTRGGAKPGQKISKQHIERLRKLGLDEPDPVSILNKLDNGTKEQKKAAAELMRDVIQNVHGQARNQWKSEFKKALKQDWLGGGEAGIGSMPRMLIGGITMAGGPGIFMDENLTMGDKARALLIGAFLLKHGKELTYKDYNTKTWERYEGTFMGGRKPMGSFSERFRDADVLVRALGGKMESKNNLMWGALQYQVYNDARHDRHMNQNSEGYSNPEVLDGLKKLWEFKSNEKADDMFRVDLESETSQRTIEKNKRGPQVEGELGWKLLYQRMATDSKFDSIVGEGKRPKDWSELTVGQKKVYIEKMKEMNFKPGMRGIVKMNKLYHSANHDLFDLVKSNLTDNVKEIANILNNEGKVPDKLWEFDSETKTYTFRKIEISEVIGKLNEVQQWQVIQYNHMINAIAKHGPHKIAKEKIKFNDNTMPGKEAWDSFAKKTILAKQQSNKDFGIGKESQFEYSDMWFQSAFNYHEFYRVNEVSMKELDRFVEKNPEIIALLRTTGSDMADASIALKIKIKEAKNDKNESAKDMESNLNDFLKAVRLTQRSAGTFSAGAVKELTMKDARKIMKSLENHKEPILAFKNYNDKYMAKQSREAALNSKKNELLDETLVLDSEGKKQPLTDEDFRIIEMLEAENIILPGTFTIRSWARELFDISDALSKKGTPLEFKDNTEFLKILKENGADAKTIESVENLLKLESFAGSPKAIQDVIKVYENSIKRYMRNETNGTGILENSPGEKIALTEIQIRELVDNINNLENGGQYTSEKLMLEALRKEFLESGRDWSAFENEAKAKKYILSALTSGNLKSKDAVDVVALSMEWGIYDFYGSKFKKLNETQWQGVFEKMKKAVDTQWVDSESVIQRRYEELLDQKGIDPGEYNKLDIEQVLANNKFDKFAVPKDSRLSHKAYIQNKFMNEYNSDINKFTTDFMQDFIKNNKDSRVTDSEMANTVISLLAENNKSIRIRKYKFNAESPNKTTHSNDTVRKTHVIDRIERMFGQNAEIAILEGTNVTFGGMRASLFNTDNRIQVGDAMLSGQYRTQNEKMDLYGDGFEFGNTSYFMYQYGGNKYAYLIEKSNSSIKTMTTEYKNYLNRLENEGVISKEEKAERLEKTGFITDGTEITYKEGATSETTNNNLKKMLDDYILGDILGESAWWGGIQKSKGKEAAKIFKRLKLFDNISAKRFDTKTVNELSDFVSKNPDWFGGDKQVGKDLKRFANGEWKEVILRDEGGNNTWSYGGQDFGIADIHSVMKQEIQNLADKMSEIEIAKANKKINSNDADTLLNGLQIEIDNLTGDIASGKLADASNVNGITFVSDRAFKALQVLAGHTDPGIGGIKPIVLRTGENMYVNKTAFARKSEFAQLFASNKVDFITFTSASKKIGEYKVPTYSSQQFFNGLKPEVVLKGGLDVHTIRPEDMQIVSVKAAKNEASIGINHANELTTSRDSFMNYVWGKEGESKLGEFRNKGSLWTNPKRWIEQISQFKLWRKSKSQEKGSQELDNADFALLDIMAENNIHPDLLRFEKDKMWFTNEVEPLLKPKLPGGQAVLVPDIDISGKKTLRDTILVGDRIYDAGEILLPDSAKNTTIDADNTSVWLRVDAGYDKLIRLSEVKGMKKNYRKIQTLGELAEALPENYQVNIVSERQPHTKTSSIMPVALKGFKDSRDGNIVALNQSDLKRAAEGDFDIDTINYFASMPHDVMLEYAVNRARVRDSVDTIGLGEGNNMASWKNLDMDNPNSQINYLRQLEKAKIQLGTTMKSQTNLAWFLNNASKADSQYRRIVDPIYGSDGAVMGSNGPGESVGGMLLKLPENTYIHFKKGADINQVYQEIANMNQHIVDMDNGFNTGVFKDTNSVYNRIFFGENGLFEVYKMSEFKVTETINGQVRQRSDKMLVKQDSEIDIKYKEAITNRLIRPYTELLNASQYIFDKGQQQSPSLNNLMRQIKEYNSNMRQAEYLIAKDLGVKYEKGTILAGFGDNAQIKSNRTGEGFSRTNMVYDTLLAQILHVGELKLKNTRDSIVDKSENLDGSLDKFLMSQDMMGDFSRKIKKDSEKWDYANALENKIRELKKLRNKTMSNFTKTQLSEKIKNLEEFKDNIKEEIDIGPDIRNQIVEHKMKQAEYEYYKDNRKAMDSDTRKKKRKLFEEQVKKGKNVVEEIGYDHEVVRAMALVEGFGKYTNMSFSELGMDRTNFAELSKAASATRRDFGIAWSAFRNGETAQLSHRDGQAGEKIAFVNEAHIYQYFTNRMREESVGFNTMQEQNIYIAKIMTPKVDFTRVIKYKDLYFPTPESKRIEKYIKLGLRYNSQFFGNQMQLNFLKGMSKSYEMSLQYLTTGHPNSFESNSILGERLKQSNEGGFYFDPFTYAANHGKIDLINALNPNATEYSRLSGYHQMHKLFGTGLIKDTVNMHVMNAIPVGMIGNVGRHSRAISLNGQSDLQKMNEIDNSVFIMSGNRGSVFDVGQQLYNLNPYKSERSKYSPSEWTAEKNKENNKWCD